MPYTPRPKREVTCETCGKTAFTHAPKWRFCSAKCKDAFWNRTASCSDCGAAMWRHGRLSETPRCGECRLRGCGTVAAYKRGCRCVECREAWNAQCRNYKSAARKLRAAPRDCVACGTSFQPRSNQILCSPECRKAMLGRYGDHRSRATHWGVEYERIDREAVFERDGWACGICSLPVDREIAFPDPGAATLDHVVPMSQGGGHVMANVQLAHFYCNTAKGNRLEIAC